MRFRIVALAVAHLTLTAQAPGPANSPTQPNHPSRPNPRLPGITLAATDLTPATTRDELVARWGAPLPSGIPGTELYRVQGGSRLWVTFEPAGSRRLTRAILLDNGLVPQVTILVDAPDLTESRRRDQLDLSRGLRLEAIVAAWGPPDSLAGSEIPYGVWRMADGEMIAMAIHCGVTCSRDAPPGPPRMDAESLRRLVSREGEITYMGTTPQSTHAAPRGTYIAALFADTSDAVQDYHWYHHAPDGSWYGKNGASVSDLDAAGERILNPVAANNNYGRVGNGTLNYETFVGYFAVRPGAIRR